MKNQPLALRSSLDSRVQVHMAGTGQYDVLVRGLAGEPVKVASLSLHQSYVAAAQSLPFYLEDLVTEDRALVRVRYDARHVQLQVLNTDSFQDGTLVQVEGIPAAMEQLQVPKAPRLFRHGQGHLTSGSETVARHHDASGVDLAMGSIAEAEGGFASTEGSDGGVFTWGQGQWTVTEGESNLQDVLNFIKARRPDLFAHYFSSHGLDLHGRAFRFQGTEYPFSRPRLVELFCSSPERNRQLVQLFAQAGTDPQIQRLQRQFLRHEVEETLSKPVKRGGEGHSPTKWLTPRALALYYSMYKNLPGPAQRNLLGAISAAGGGADSEVTQEQRERASQALEELFHNSSIKAPDPQNEGRWYAFWGEKGRADAIAQADARRTELRAQLAQTKDATARKRLTALIGDWSKHRTDLENRKSRYQKTVKSLEEQHIEEPLPPDARKSIVTQPQTQTSAQDSSLGYEDGALEMSIGPDMSIELNHGGEQTP